MKIGKYLLEGLKVTALLGAIALVVWSMPEYTAARPQDAAFTASHQPPLR